MKLMVAPYNAGVPEWAETEETQFRSYTIEHGFNKPARCIITLNDPDGSLMRKYNCDTNDVYLGVGKLTLEDPDDTDIFYGRIKRVTANSKDKTCILECYDWLDQLDEEIITYDMREKLSGNIRQSTITSDYDDTDGLGIKPAHWLGAGSHIYDKNDFLTVDAHNGQKLVFTTGMAGSRTWSAGPYQCTHSAGEGAGDFQSNDVSDVWVDNTDSCVCWDDDEDWTSDFDVKIFVGHNTPSNLYIHDSVTAASVDITHQFKDDSGEDSLCEVQIYDMSAAAYVDIGYLDPYDTARGSIYTRTSIQIPDHALDCVDASGIAKIRFNVTRGAGTTYLYISYCMFNITCETTGLSTVYSIFDGETYRLSISDINFTAAATCLWDGIPYCITEPIYLHFESATGPILGGDSVVTLTCGVANVENTTGVSTTQFKDKTRLQIARSLATQDASVFWITLGGSTVTYKKTFGADTMQLTDGKVLSWESLHDYGTMFNSFKVYGVRIGDYEIYQLSENAASKTKYLNTKSKVLRGSYVSDADAAAVGTALAARENEVSQMVGCTIYGNTITAAHATTIKLGEVVEITSSYLWPAAAAKDYIVSHLTYDSDSNTTHLTMYPKASTGDRTIEFPNPTIDSIKQDHQTEKYVPDPVTHEVA